ncbi:hypothetical protein DXG03_000408 [Asterophora parasitica]|uniref:Glucose-methanol-choline oxidoreductase N-terminal domain-containing protein n=1 Tax=Asterophora parasitica TaxID=117018 RepID=A0A9P7KFY9_9AGAR|nr:hypothetical protein DXG03_000408 [Asterophora parasitica]
MPSDNATYDIIFVGDHIQPARYFSNLVLPSETFTHHVGKPSPSLAGRAVIVPTGRCVGGGSSVNFINCGTVAMYTRAAASDYDDWEIVHKNPGWGSKQLISLLKKAETFQNGGDAETHGTSGPIKASFADENFNVGSQFLAVAAQYDKDPETPHHSYVDLTNGRRSDTPHNYIYDKGHNGLTILERRRVVRVIFE